ncbi:MAG TPA: ribonuclease P protein component [archaeon]|nr:ribonuclease P protein component [archaeon]
MGFPRKCSIRKSTEIKKVIEKGRNFSDDVLGIYLLPADSSSPSRVAFVVPRFRHTIAARNRLKRRLQELIRFFPTLSQGYLIVIRIGPACYETTFPELRQRLSSLVEKIIQHRAAH